MPENLVDIQHTLSRRRSSLSERRFSNEDFAKFKEANANGFKEKAVTESVFPFIQGTLKDPRCVLGGIPYENLNQLTDTPLAPGNPDRYYGARPEQLDRDVRRKLSGLITFRRRRTFLSY